MATLFRLAADATAIAVRFGAQAGDDPWKGGMLSPGKFAPVITAGREFVAGPRPEGGLPQRLVPRLWGVPPPPSAIDPARLVHTVRNPDSPFWIGSLRNSEFRCLVPASSFMIPGKADPASGKRRLHWLACADQPLFAMAGVWKDSEVPSFALMTTEANAHLRDLGIERMPVILPVEPRSCDLWLRADWTRASALVLPYPSSMVSEVTPP